MTDKICFDLDKAVRAAGVSLLEKETGLQQSTLPKSLRENGLSWPGGEPLVWYYDREKDAAIVMTESTDKRRRAAVAEPSRVAVQE